MLYLILSATATILTIIYYYEVVVHVREEQSPMRDYHLCTEWIHFIEKNVDKSVTPIHCNQCLKMIILFDQRFRQGFPAVIFNEWLNDLYNYADIRYRQIVADRVDLSEITSEMLLE